MLKVIFQGNLSENIYRIHSDGNVQVPNKIFSDKTKDVKRMSTNEYSDVIHQKSDIMNHPSEESDWETISVKEFGKYQKKHKLPIWRLYLHVGSDYSIDGDYLEEFGEDYVDNDDQYSAFTKHLSKDDEDFSYVDKKGIMVTVLDVNATCCRPLKVKCTVESKDTEECTIQKGLHFMQSF